MTFSSFDSGRHRAAVPPIDRYPVRVTDPDPTGNRSPTHRRAQSDPRSTAGLTLEDAEARYAAEAQQGTLIADQDLEHVWGWTSPAGRIRAERRARFLIDSAHLKPGVRCLEIGAGTGEFTQRLAQSGCELDALEISPATAEVCQQRVGTSARVLVGNVETGAGLSTDHQYDAIVGVSVLHHVNLDLTFAKTFPLLRPGGRFAFSEPNMANPQVWGERHIALVKRVRHVTEHETAFRVKDLRSLSSGLDSSSRYVSRSSSCIRRHPHR